MCGSLSRDWKAKDMYTKDVEVRPIIRTGKGFIPDTESILGSFLAGNINARSESLEKIWFTRYGAFLCQMTSEKINSFTEHSKLIVMPEKIDVLMIAIPPREIDQQHQLRVVTRADGMNYYKGDNVLNQKGNWPPFTDEKIATMEHKTHSRWPWYIRRLAA